MKKTVAAFALGASSSLAFAEGFQAEEFKTYCLGVYENEQGVKYGETCDSSENNKTLGKAILANGCAEGQVSLTTHRFAGETKFQIEIEACLPPNVVQL